MKNSIRILAGILCAAFLLSPATSLGQVEKVKWIYSYEEALAEAEKTGRPIFLEFRCAP